MAQSSEEPPFLPVGTDVSAKYRGAFCEANVKVVKKLVKCKITITKTNTSLTVHDDCVKGALKVGATVEAKTPDGQFMEGIITKLTDASVYTVVFDDGDERTLRRTSLCLKGERHFNESETLDHLPLTDPENFGTPVVQDGKKRKKRRLSQAASMDDSETEREEQAPSVAPSKKKCLFDDSILGKVVVVENRCKRRNMWFPALGVNPSKNEADLIKSREKCVVRSFDDGKYHVVNVKDTKDFTKDQDPVHGVLKGENKKIKPAVERALAYLETGRVPGIWEENASDVIVQEDSEEDSKKAHSSEDESSSVDEDGEKKAFKEKLLAFMKDKGTPIARPPILGNQDLDLHKLYKIVQEHGGMEKVSNEPSLWRKIYQQMDIAVVPPSASHHIKMAYKKYLYPFELHEKKSNKTSEVEVADHDSCEKNIKPESPESPGDSSDEKHLECLEPLPDIDDEHDEVTVKKPECKQSSRIKEMKRQQSREFENGVLSDSQTKSPEEDESVDVVNSPESSSDVSEPPSDGKSDIPADEYSFEVGDKIQVKYGRGRNHRLYDAKIIHIDSEASEGTMYCIHYAGWNNRYDEWIKPEKIASWGTRQTRNRTGGPGSAAKGQETNAKSPPKPVTRPTAKPSGRRTNKATAGAGKEASAKQLPPANGTKSALKRPCSPSTRSGSLSPSLGKSPKSGSGRGTTRTRSERSSASEMSNGLEEVKSPPSRRRQKSATPEPLLEPQIKSVDVVSTVQTIPEAIQEETDDQIQEKRLSASNNDSEDIGKKATLCESKTAQENPGEERKADHTCNLTNGKRKERHKKILNGMTKSMRSPETVSRDLEDVKGAFPEVKKIKLEHDVTTQNSEVDRLHTDNSLAPSPNQPLQTQGTPTAMETVSSSSSSSEDTKSEHTTDSGASTSAQCSNGIESAQGSVENNCSGKNSGQNHPENDKKDQDSKAEKKSLEQNHRKHKKRKEKKKHRHASGNDSTGSDAPGSPLYNQSAGVFSSPRRPRVSFDMDLEEIKAKEDGGERIRLLQDKIKEMRKVYSSLKAEVASIDRKRKKLKKKREVADAIETQDLQKSIPASSSSSSSSSHNLSSSSIPPVECR